MKYGLAICWLLFVAYISSSWTVAYVPKTGREFRRLYPHLRRIRVPVIPKTRLRREHKLPEKSFVPAARARVYHRRYANPLMRRSVIHLRRSTEEKPASQSHFPNGIFEERPVKTPALKRSRDNETTVGNNRTPAKTAWRFRSNVISRQRQSIINKCRNIKEGKCCKGWTRQTITGTCMPFCPTSCIHGDCDGRYVCKCKEGFTGPLCNIDINECAKTPCDHGCVNLYGGYRCVCHAGYVLGKNGSCKEKAACQAKRCQYKCYSSGGDAKCLCPRGYTVASNGRTCKDTNECTEKDVKCTDSGINRYCKNLPGSYVCGCKEGYFYHRFFKICYDSDECLTEKHNCDAVKGKCINTYGSYRCECRDTFVGDGVTCTAINSVQQNDPTSISCHPYATNPNTTSEDPACICQSGFTGDGFTCTDLNECLNPENGCAKRYGYCVNTKGSYDCRCRPGYIGDGRTCVRTRRRRGGRRPAGLHPRVTKKS